MITLFTSNTNGGIIQLTVQLLTTLDELEFDVSCFMPEGTLATVPEGLYKKIHYYRKFKALNPFDARVKRLADMVYAARPSLLWYMDSGILCLQMGLQFKKSIRQILTLHDAGTWHPTNKINIKKHFQMMYSEILCKKSVKTMSNVLVLSKESKKVCEKQFFQVTDRILLMTLGAHVPDIEAQIPVELSCMEQGYYLFFGRIDKYKGIQKLCDTYEQLDEKKLPLIIAGSGILTKEEQESVNAGSKIKMLNRYISDAEMIWLFRHARAVVLPYIEATQSGIIPIAYKYGVPVITSDIPGLTQFVVDGKTGVVCLTDRDYVSAYKRLSDEKIHASMAKNCIEYEKKYFSWNKNVKQLLIEIGIFT